MITFDSLYSVPLMLNSISVQFIQNLFAIVSTIALEKNAQKRRQWVFKLMLKHAFLKVVSDDIIVAKKYCLQLSFKVPKVQ